MKPGDHCIILMGGPVRATIIEDRGNLGPGGSQIWRVQKQLKRAGDEEESFEVPESAVFSIPKANAISTILHILSSPLRLMSPERAEALATAKEHQVTAEDLLAFAVAAARRT